MPCAEAISGAERRGQWRLAPRKEKGSATDSSYPLSGTVFPAGK